MIFSSQNSKSLYSFESLLLNTRHGSGFVRFLMHAPQIQFLLGAKQHHLFVNAQSTRIQPCHMIMKTYVVWFDHSNYVSE